MGGHFINSYPKQEVRGLQVQLVSNNNKINFTRDMPVGMEAMVEG